MLCTYIHILSTHASHLGRVHQGKTLSAIYLQPFTLLRNRLIKRQQQHITPKVVNVCAHTPVRAPNLERAQPIKIAPRMTRKSQYSQGEDASPRVRVWKNIARLPSLLVEGENLCAFIIDAHVDNVSVCLCVCVYASPSLNGNSAQVHFHAAAPRRYCAGTPHG